MYYFYIFICMICTDRTLKKGSLWCWVFLWYIFLSYLSFFPSDFLRIVICCTRLPFSVWKHWVWKKKKKHFLFKINSCVDGFSLHARNMYMHIIFKAGFSTELHVCNVLIFWKSFRWCLSPSNAKIEYSNKILTF